MNESFGWTCVLLGILMGCFMGIKFQREEWLGGYSAFPRRMLRLAHIALVAIGMLNIQFANSHAAAALTPGAARISSSLLMAAGVLMPLCCLTAGFLRRWFAMFAAPVACLVIAVALALTGTVALPAAAGGLR